MLDAISREIVAGGTSKLSIKHEHVRGYSFGKAREETTLLDSDEIEWSESLDQHVVTRDGARIGFLVDAMGHRIRYFDKPKTPQISHIAFYTDLVAQRRSSKIAIARRHAQVRGCWRWTAYTPDVCCANGGWQACWARNFSYETCCQGWVSKKDFTFLAALRMCLMKALASTEQLNAAHYYYLHALFFSALVSMIDEKRSKLLVEVGVAEAVFASVMLSDLEKRGTLVERYYAIDPWLMAIDYGRGAFLNASRRLAAFWPVPAVLQLAGEAAAQLFAEDSIDFVFLDAHHDYESVLRDLETWYPKIRSGGILAGHDYAPEKVQRYPGAVSAVQLFAHRLGMSSCLFGVTGTSFVLLKMLPQCKAADVPDEAYREVLDHAMEHLIAQQD